MNKTALLFLFFVGLAFAAGAQELKVLEFRADPSMTDATRFPKEDLNGDRCGLIRLGLVMPDAIFEGDIISSEYKDGEWWIYMIKDANWITIKSAKYLPLRYEFEGIQSNITYVMNVEKPQIAYEGPTGTLRIECNVKDASVYVDGENQGSLKDNKNKIVVPEGKHDIELRHAGYNHERLSIDIKPKQTLSYTITMHVEGTFAMNGISYEMVKVAGGSFTMGTNDNINKTATLNIAPIHDVTLRNYKIGATEVTQALWETVMGSNPSLVQSPNLPVSNVTWDDCQEFITKLNQQSGSHFRLPTEAEWEYAARSCAANDGKKLPSGSVYKQAACKNADEAGTNPMGIKGMNGNVAEWCEDWFGSYLLEKQTNPTGPSAGVHRVVRGGSYQDTTDWPLRGTSRSHYAPDEASPTIGFRLAMDD